MSAGERSLEQLGRSNGRHFAKRDRRVGCRKLLLSEGLEIESTLVLVGVAVLRAEEVVAFALEA